MRTTISQLTENDAAIHERISNWLSADAESKGFDYAPQPIVLKLEQQGEMVAGLVGKTNWGWMYIEKLAVAPECRGKRFGEQLVRRAEKIAINRECFGSWLDTYSFQAVGFYQKLGYQPFGQLPQYPNKETRFFLYKHLRRTAGAQGIEPC